MQRSTANWSQAGVGRLQLTGAQLCLLRVRGPESAIRGHFEGRGVPGTTGYTLGAGGGAAQGGRSLHLPGLVPPAGSARRGGSRTCRPRARWPPASRRLPRAACGSPWPRRAAQIRTRRYRSPTRARIASVSVVTPHAQRGFLPLPSALQQSGKSQVGRKRMISFAKREKNPVNFNPSGEGKVSLQG